MDHGVDRGTVLVLRALHLGDILVALPALRALRRAYPDRRIVLAAPHALAPIVARSGAVDALLGTSAPDALCWSGLPPGLVVNLHGAGPQSHRALEAVRAPARIGFRPPDGEGGGWVGPAWDAATGRHERERWCDLLEYAGVAADPLDLALSGPARQEHDGPVLVHPGARYGAKRWPAERFARVAAALTLQGRCVLVTGSGVERRLATEVAERAGLGPEHVLAGRTDLDGLCDLVARAALVVSGDTGIAHLASAYRTPSVVLFGPVGPRLWGPPTTGPHIALTGTDRRGDPFADDPDPALLTIGVDDVLRAAALVQQRG